MFIKEYANRCSVTHTGLLRHRSHSRQAQDRNFDFDIIYSSLVCVSCAHLPSGTLWATHTADVPVSSGIMWKIHASRGSTTVRASPPIARTFNVSTILRLREGESLSAAILVESQHACTSISIEDNLSILHNFHDRMCETLVNFQLKLTIKSEQYKTTRSL